MRSIRTLKLAGRTQGGRADDRDSNGVNWDAVVPVGFGLVIGGVVWFAMGAYEGGHDLATGIAFAVGAWLLVRWLLAH